MSAPAAGARCTAGLALAAALAAGCSAEPPPPNVVLITLDTFRTDRIGAYGSDGALTPALDELAAKALVFDAAMTPIGTTHPAHASLFTGLYPGDHGVRFNGDALDESFVTLAQYLEVAGYDTAAFVSKYSLVRQSGFGRGFGEIIEEDAEAKDFRIRGRNVNRAARAWMARRSPDQAPFFLWLHYFDAHSPYPLSGTARKRMADYEGPYKEGASVGAFYAYGDEVPATAENRAALEALYDGQVVEIDRLVGRVLEGLEERGLLENTVVVVTADHGQMLGEHARVGHGRKLFEPVLSVPLLVWWPGHTTPRRVTERVSLLDLFPTLLELAGIEPPRAIEGRSLLDVVRGGAVEERPYFASVRVPKIKDDTVPPPEDKKAVAVYDGRHKLVFDDDGALLFDLVADPDELSPLPEGEERDALLQRLLPLALEHRERERPLAEATDLAPEVLEELRALGYLR